MTKLACISVLAVLATVLPATAETAVPDLRGTWTGESESIVLGRGNPHHAGKQVPEPRLGMYCLECKSRAVVPAKHGSSRSSNHSTTSLASL